MTALVGNTTQDNHAAAARVNDPRFQITGPANKMPEARRRPGSICPPRHHRGVFVLLRLRMHQLDFGGGAGGPSTCRGAGGRRQVIYDGREEKKGKVDLRWALNQEPRPINGGGRSERSSAAAQPKSRRIP